MKQIMMNDKIIDITAENAPSLITQKISSKGCEHADDPFYVGDLGDVVEKYRLWTSELPRIEPFYAVKCNDDLAVLSTLAQLGIGFDCASKAEIQKVISMKVAPDRIVYANPCKQNSHIQYAAMNSVSMMTFDNETELHKVKAIHPKAQLIIRIAPPDDSKSQCQLGMKFGCTVKAIPKLLRVAKQLDLNVVGVSFHVGSGCYDSSAYLAAVTTARTAFDIAERMGFHFKLLDIGGGFPGQPSTKITFEEICSVLRPAIDTYFPETMPVRIIAEPGRFFVASAFTLAVCIIAKRRVCRDETCQSEDFTSGPNDEPKFMYYVNDGVYGSFNCLLYDHASVHPTIFKPTDDVPVYSSSIWGPTCDGLDCISEESLLPELDTGEWIVFKDMGAYTMCAASNFNGMPKPRSYYVMQDATWRQLDAYSRGSTKVIRKKKKVPTATLR